MITCTTCCKCHIHKLSYCLLSQKIVKLPHPPSPENNFPISQALYKAYCLLVLFSLGYGVLTLQIVQGLNCYLEYGYRRGEKVEFLMQHITLKQHYELINENTKIITNPRTIFIPKCARCTIWLLQCPSSIKSDSPPPIPPHHRSAPEHNWREACRSHSPHHVRVHGNSTPEIPFPHLHRSSHSACP